MNNAEIIALLALVVSAISLLLTAKHRASDDWRHEIDLERRAREHDMVYCKTEIDELRKHRHRIGEAPGLAAMTKAEDVAKRVERLERKVFNGTAGRS